MKFRLAGFAVAAAGAIAFGGVVSAQNVPAQFVVSGKAAEQIQDFTTINLATAERIAETCEKLAAEQNVAISIYVLDNDGNHVYMDRMDGQGYLNIITAEMKARTALMQRGAEQGRHEPGPPESERRSCSGSSSACSPNSGGLPIVVNKQMIGVIGIGGSAPRVPVWSDEICGHKALQEVLGAANVAPLIEDLPQSAERRSAPTRRRFRASRPRRRRRRACRTPSGWSAARARPTSSTATRFRWRPRRRSPGSAATSRRPRAAACRSTSSTPPASSCTWSGWTGRCSTTSAPR